MSFVNTFFLFWKTPQHITSHLSPTSCDVCYQMDSLTTRNKRPRACDGSRSALIKRYKPATGSNGVLIHIKTLMDDCEPICQLILAYGGFLSGAVFIVTFDLSAPGTLTGGSTDGCLGVFGIHDPVNIMTYSCRIDPIFDVYNIHGGYLYRRLEGISIPSLFVNVHRITKSELTVVVTRDKVSVFDRDFQNERDIYHKDLDEWSIGSSTCTNDNTIYVLIQLGFRFYRVVRIQRISDGWCIIRGGEFHTNIYTLKIAGPCDIPGMIYLKCGGDVYRYTHSPNITCLELIENPIRTHGVTSCEDDDIAWRSTSRGHLFRVSQNITTREVKIHSFHPSYPSVPFQSLQCIVKNSNGTTRWIFIDHIESTNECFFRIESDGRIPTRIARLKIPDHFFNPSLN